MEKSASDAVNVSGCRTPIGKFGGNLKDLRARQLAAKVLTEAVRRYGVATLCAGGGMSMATLLELER